jgi:Calx-beta domain/Bacterial pre-peptidase C-terminal domain
MSFRSSRKGRRARPAGARLAVLAALCVAAAAVLLAGFARAGAQDAGVPSAQKVKRRAAAGGGKQAGRTTLSQAEEGRAKPGWSGEGAGVAADQLGCTTNPSSIVINTTLNGTLSTTTDCRHPGDNTLYDAYSFSGTAGQLVTVELRSGQFNSYLYLLKPGETTLTDFTMQDDNGLDPDPDDNDDILDARIVTVLPTTGTYTVLANTFPAFGSPSQTGNYELRVRGGCGLTPIPAGARDDALAGNECQLTDGSFVDVFSFTATAGQQISITMTSTAFDTFLLLLGPDGFTRLAENDDGTQGGPTGLGNSNARIPGPPYPQEEQLLGAGLATLPATGTYYILANSFRPNTTGAYRLTLTFGSNTCPTTPITVGQTLNGALASTDCRLPFDGSFLDAYTFAGTAGQQIAVTMTSSEVDSYLFLLNPAGQALVQDNSGAGGQNARIPPIASGQPAGFFTLPTSGTYTIYANSAVFDLVETAAVEGDGPYTLSLTSPANCAPTLPQTSRQNASGAGGQFSDAYNVAASCAAPAATSNASWITNVTVDAPDTSGAGLFRYTLAQNNDGQSRTGTINVGGQTFTVTQLPFCSLNIFPATLPFGESGGSGRLTVVPPQNCQPWAATTNTPWITINTGTGAGTGRVTYTVAANTTGATRVGTVVVNNRTHTVTQTSASTTPTVEFSQGVFSVSEGDATRRIRVTVTRLGDTQGAATVEFRTIDPDNLPQNSETPCNPERTSARGTAFARCDYATTIDTISFNPNEVSKSFDIPLIDDVHFEGTETFSVELNNARGANIGVRQTAAISITDDDTAPPTNNNPIRVDTRVDASLRFKFFVRMQYLDFLSREPEEGEPWTNVLNNCANPFSTPFDNPDPSAGCNRVIVSQSFFESEEFRLKGFFVFLYHKVSFGSSSNPNFVPNYPIIVADMRRVTGFTAEETFAKRLDFSEDFVLRPAFTTRYPTTMTAAQFVDTLLANVGASLTTADPDSGATRNSLVADLTSGAKTRAQVLRIVVESREVNDRQFNHAFVAMQFYGYLRRTPDADGYQAWLNAINPPRSESPRIMVFGFLESTEYLWRFGSN